MYSESLIKLAIIGLQCSQKELAGILKVSPTQISKWKSGERMSTDMGERITSLLELGTCDPDVAYWTGGIEQAIKWKQLIQFLASSALDRRETDYISEILIDDEDDYELTQQTLSTLRNMGVKIPTPFPEELTYWDARTPDLQFKYDNNPLAALIEKAFEAANGIYSFYAAYIDTALSFEIDGHQLSTKIYCGLIPLCFAKTGKQNGLTPNFNLFQHHTISDLGSSIDSIKKLAFQHNIPLNVELSDLITDNSDDLNIESDAETIGANQTRIHPDIYMNELLQNQRSIMKALPIICKKLGITSEELDWDNINY